MAKARASDAATRVAHDAIQTFGGLGFTWEHDVHFFLKRARVGATLMGSARQHRDQVATLAGLNKGRGSYLPPPSAQADGRQSRGSAAPRARG
jgi:alkylation response protein AidB-like acyl-CoA dehydrogenase